VYSLFNLYLQNYYGLQFWINTYICSEPVCLYLFWSRVLYFLAQFRSDHFSKQIGLNPGCSVMQQGGTGTSCITKSLSKRLHKIPSPDSTKLRADFVLPHSGRICTFEIRYEWEHLLWLCNVNVILWNIIFNFIVYFDVKIAKYKEWRYLPWFNNIFKAV
jgi:hypothetical protein